MPDLSGTTLGGFRLVSAIGQGGMATVYLGRGLEDGRRVAIKVLRSQIAENASFLERFRREARVLLGLTHPNIVSIEAFEEADGIAYLVMPLVEAGSLSDRLGRGPLHPVEGGRIVGEMSAALQYAHDRQIIHRDVKPSNILIDSSGRSMLSDFGLAQVADATLSLTGSALVGTPAYASPEQATGRAVTARSDQYSLGIVLFEMTTGALPFEAETPLAVLLKHANEPTPRPRSVNPNIPEAVERVILRATAKRPDDRFESVGEMNTAFQAALAHTLDPLENPAPTIPLPAVERVSRIQREERRKRRRRNLLAGAALLLALLLCGGTAFLTGLLGAAKPEGEGAQLTSLAGTIQALSTGVAAEQRGTLAPGQLQDAVLATLAAGEETPEPTSLALALGLGASPSPTREMAGSPAVSPDTLTSTAGVLPQGSAPVSPTTAALAATSTQPPTQTLPPPTSTPPPTATPVPPTATQPPSPCDLTQFVGSSQSGQELTVVLRNSGASPYTITRMTLSWPDQNEDLKKIELDGDEIWDGEAASPQTITNWKPGSDRRIQPGGNRDLELFFERQTAPSGYGVSITLDATCTFSFQP